jgi:hypothetical protein
VAVASSDRGWTGRASGGEDSMGSRVTEVAVRQSTWRVGRVATVLDMVGSPCGGGKVWRVVVELGTGA